MFKERVGRIIIYLYLQLHRYRAKGGDINSLLEQGKKEGAEYMRQVSDSLPESVVNANTSAKEMFVSAAEQAKDVMSHPRESAGEVVEKVSDQIVKAAKSARDALSGDKNTDAVKEAVQDAVDTAKGEVKGAMEQVKQKK